MMCAIVLLLIFAGCNTREMIGTNSSQSNSVPPSTKAESNVDKGSEAVVPDNDSDPIFSIKNELLQLNNVIAVRYVDANTCVALQNNEANNYTVHFLSDTGNKSAYVSIPVNLVNSNPLSFDGENIYIEYSEAITSTLSIIKIPLSSMSPFPVITIENYDINHFSKVEQGYYLCSTTDKTELIHVEESTNDIVLTLSDASYASGTISPNLQSFILFAPMPDIALTNPSDTYALDLFHFEGKQIQTFSTSFDSGQVVWSILGDYFALWNGSSVQPIFDVYSSKTGELVYRSQDAKPNSWNLVFDDYNNVLLLKTSSAAQ